MPSNAMGSCAKFELATAAAQVERDCWTPAAAAAAGSGGAERVRYVLSNCALSAAFSFWSFVKPARYCLNLSENSMP
jgi:hypothetical protein